jgi:hypothetical protein
MSYLTFIHDGLPSYIAQAVTKCGLLEYSRILSLTNDTSPKQITTKSEIMLIEQTKKV